MYIHVFDRLTLRFDKLLYAEVDSRGPVVLWSDLQKLLKEHHAARQCLCFDWHCAPVARVVPAFGSSDVVGLIFSNPLNAPVWFGGRVGENQHKGDGETGRENRGIPVIRPTV